MEALVLGQAKEMLEGRAASCVLKHIGLSDTGDIDSGTVCGGELDIFMEIVG